MNVIVLGKIISVTGKEYRFEKKKIKLDEKRADKNICRTQYPILMVHGVFFRDFQNFNYWGRVPEELEKNGATIYYGNHQSAASVHDCAEELADRIKHIVKEAFLICHKMQNVGIYLKHIGQFLKHKNRIGICIF